MPEPNPKATVTRSNLDVLRSFAVCLVVLDHTALARNIHAMPWHWDPAWIGVAGVFMFFVHTALVLMWSLERKPHTLDFYIRRIFRIYPLAIVAVLAALLFRAPVAGSVFHFFEFHRPGHLNLLAVLLLVQNIVPSPQPILGVLWSLPLEVDMYILLPVVFAFVHRDRSLWTLLLFWLLACGVCHTLFPKADNNFPTVIACFLPGIMAYRLFSRVRPRIPSALLPVLLFALTAGFMQQPSTRRGWVFCLLLGLALPFFRDFRHPIITRPAHLIARYSFGVYLFHPFALVLAFYLLPRRPLALQYAVELLAIVTLSVAGYHLVEHPFIRLGSRVAAIAEKHLEQHAPTPDAAQPL